MNSEEVSGKIVDTFKNPADDKLDILASW
jgi:hypothetical protein